jgi:PAS domain S-box-containing protein
MTHLDIRTLLGLLAIVNIFLSLVILAYWRTQRVYPGFGLWSLCNAMVAVIWVLFFLRGHIPAFVSIVIPTSLALVAAILRLEGLRRFLGRERFDLRTIAVPLVGLILLVYFTSGRNDPYARTAISVIVVALVVWTMAWLVIVRATGRHRMTYAAIGALWLLYGALNFGRGIYWLALGQGNPLLQSSQMNVVYYVASIVFDIAWTVIFITMTHQRTALDLETAQEVAEESRDSLADLVAFLPDATFAVNERGEVISWNRAAEDLTGVGAGEVLGRSYRDSAIKLLGAGETILLDLALDPTVPAPEHYSEVKRDGERISAEIDDAEAGDRTISLWAIATPLRDSTGRLRGAIQSMRDITTRRMSQRALKETEEQLRQSQKMEAVGQLAGGIAHDFNNLLTAIIGYSDLVLVSPEIQGTQAKEDVLEIRKAADRAGALTRQILAYSRRQALRPQVVSLNEVVSELEPLLVRTIGENIELVAVPHPDLGLVEVDLHQLEQVLLNLAVNARDAMPAGGRLVIETANIELDDDFCGTHPDLQMGRYVLLAVSDTGVGMDEETRNHVFEPFFTTKGPGEGTGLGLSVVYGIVRQSGGNVFVYSEPGLGTTFRLYLPRVDRKEGPAEVEAEGLVSPEGDETILLVEDEQALRSIMARTLGDLGYRVLSAQNAAEALKILSETEFDVDLLLTDIVLSGGMHGNELAQSVQTSRPDMAVLYVSGYARNAILHAGRLEEGVNYLEKPFSLRTLAVNVRQILEAHKTGRSGGLV